MSINSSTPPIEEIDEAEEKLFLIPQLIGVLRWGEELIVALSGYGIVFALAVGVVDLLTDGQLTSNAPWVDYAYAISFAVAIAGQIIGLSSRSSRSFGKGQWLRGSAYTVLVLLLAFTEYQASVIFGFHKAFGTPVIQSLQELGINQGQFIGLRAGVGVFLALLSGYLRWQPTKRKSIAQLQREANYKRETEALKAQQQRDRINNAAGLFGNLGQAARQAVRQATAKEETTPESPDTEDETSQEADKHLVTRYDALEDKTGRYQPDSASLLGYQLPRGVTLTTEASMTRIADMLGTTQSAISEAWGYANMTWHGPTSAQANKATRNIQVWQVLALHDMGLLDELPRKVKVEIAA